MRKVFLAASAFLVPAALAAAALPLTFAPGSKVWVEGTSTARSWRCESTSLSGSVTAGGATLATLGAVSAGRVAVPVASLDCKNGTMNGHMRNALKADQASTLSFRATEVTVRGGEAQVQGELSMAGQSRPVTMSATVAQEDGGLRVRGTRRIDMTEWGVRPPTLMMGTMKVHPNATIGFDVILRP
jgi:polyisoprenoid-binding protein YceI